MMNDRKEPQSAENEEMVKALALYLVQGGVHGIAPIDQEPRTDLVNWRLFRVRWPGGKMTRHLIGRNVRSDEGRVCSAIQRMDLTALTFTTSSGRVYQIHGPSRYDDDASYVFDVWLRKAQAQAVEITDPFLRLLRMRAPQTFESLVASVPRTSFERQNLPVKG